MRVLKFGGTSVGSAERMRGVAEIVAGQAQEGPLLVVVSAVGGVTDALIKGAEQAAAGGSVVPALSRFHSVHREILALLRAELGPERTARSSSNARRGRSPSTPRWASGPPAPWSTGCSRRAASTPGCSIPRR